jgi:hypothetical protein
LFQLREQLPLPGESLLAANAVDGPVAGRRDDPGARVAWPAFTRPALERGRERVLHRILGELEVAAEGAGENRDRTPPLLAKGGLDFLLYAGTSASRMTTGRTSTFP